MTSAPPQSLVAQALVAQVKYRARSLGFDLVGIAPVEPSRFRDYLRCWLDDGRAGQMRYLSDRFDERADPSIYLPGVKSVICVAMNYFVPLEEPPEDQRQHHGRIARY